MTVTVSGAKERFMDETQIMRPTNFTLKASIRPYLTNLQPTISDRKLAYQSRAIARPHKTLSGGRRVAMSAHCTSFKRFSGLRADYQALKESRHGLKLKLTFTLSSND